MSNKKRFIKGRKAVVQHVRRAKACGGSLLRCNQDTIMNARQMNSSSLLLGNICSRMKGLCCVEEIHFSCASNGKKTTTRTIKVRGGRLTLKASLQHQWPLRMDGRERAELTENIQRGRCITGLWPGDVVCVVPGSLSVHDLLKSCCSSPKNTVSLTATWIMLTRTYQKHL